MKNLSIVIPFYNGHETIDRLIRSLPRKFPMIIVDDQSDVPLTQEKIDKKWEHPYEHNIKVIQSTQKGYFTGAVNRGIEACDTDVLVLNQDVWFEDTNWFGILDQYRDRYAMIGERIAGTHPAFGDLGYIHGTFMFLRRDAIEATGLLNEKDYPLWGSTAEYQWRVARRGFEVLPLREIAGFHHDRRKGQKFGSSIQTLLQKEPQKEHLLVRTPPLLSIIVPCYNYGRYLRDCVNSLIGGPTALGMMPGQTLQSFEIIIVDDASTDNSPEYIRELTDLSKGIRAYRTEKNVGTARALNAGIERAVGKYITFLSADDMRESDSLERMLRLCEQNPHSFVYDDVWIYNGHERIKQWRMPDYDFESLIWKNHVHAGIMFPRRAWEDVGGYPAIMGDGREDWAFNVALGIKGWCGVHDRHFGYLYRREGQNRTETNTTEEHRKRFLQKMMDLFPDIYMGERPMACCGKGGSNPKSNVARVSSKVSGGLTLMATSDVGKVGMTKLEYTGSKMSSTWSGPVTNAKYTFGVDKRRSWVDNRDVGSREERTGFLAMRDKVTNSYLFRVADSSSQPVKETEPIKIVSVVAESTLVANTETENVSESKAQLQNNVENADTLIAKSVAIVDFPDPTDMNVEEIKRLDLNEGQWREVYKAELAGRNRKGAIAFLEELLASFS